MLEKIMRIQPLKNDSQPSNRWKQSKRRESEGNPSFKEILASYMNDDFEQIESDVSSTKAAVNVHNVDLKI